MSNKMALIDTHRHLGGCIPTWWVWETIKKQNWSFIAENEKDVVSAMTFKKNEKQNFRRFLDKFIILDKIKWDEELIDSSISAICDDINKEKLDFVWLDFSINKYMESMNWHKKDAIIFIHNSFERYCKGKIGLILSLKYESMSANQRQYAKLIEDSDIANILFGLDLVGDESYFDYNFYKPIFRDWNAAKKMTRAHVAESQGAINGLHAIKHLKVTNIAHGIQMTNYIDMINIAKDHNITFDLGISSNYLTGIWGNKHQHPINVMVDNDVRVTIGTDDPVQCQTNLKHEFKLIKKLGITNIQIKRMKQIAIENTNKFRNNIIPANYHR